MAEFIQINGRFRQMPEVVAAAGPDARAAWALNPDQVEADCAAAETARRQADYDAAVAAAKDAGTEPPMPPAQPVDDRARRALVRAAQAREAELEEARRAAITRAPAGEPVPAAARTNRATSKKES